MNEKPEKVKFSDPKLLTAFIIKSIEIACMKNIKTDSYTPSEGYAAPFKVLAAIYEGIEIVDPPGYVSPPKPDTYGFSEEKIRSMKRLQCAYGNNGQVILSDLEFYDLRQRIPNAWDYINRLDDAISKGRIKPDLSSHYAEIRNCFELEQKKKQNG